MSFQRQYDVVRRRIEIETTLCVYWDSKGRMYFLLHEENTWETVIL